MSTTTGKPTPKTATTGSATTEDATGGTPPSVTSAAAALDGFLASAGGDGRRPGLRYLRRKPGRGLVAVFGSAGDGEVYTVSVEEAALSGVAGSAPAQGPTVRRFPDDPQLPHLATAMTPSAHAEVAEALEALARRVHGVPPSYQLCGIDAEPLRYKPGDRCVLRYRLRFAPRDESGSGTGPRTHTLVAKLYRDRAEAERADELLRRLGSEAAITWTARPLGLLGHLPLAVTEDLGSARDAVPATSGLDVIRPGDPRAGDAVRAAARALADLHTSSVATQGCADRTGEDEAGKATKRAKTLQRYVPDLTPEIAEVVDVLSRTLTGLSDDGLRPAHGSYKPSQLMVRAGQVFLVDFDQFCLADPALDVGYFLAYLRPSGLWYRRAGRRAWFDDAAAVFVSAYTQRLAERGVSSAVSTAIVGRSHVFTAALLLKIAARRANRLHSPRPGEVAAVLQEVRRCLATAEQSGVAVG
ncbi:MAG: phosphotransferase family protein [Actinomycetes bacterium]